ncbi:MAG: DEAD/DEAH box helicase, partial [Candidatus Helarchaeota archaeon]
MTSIQEFVDYLKRHKDFRKRLAHVEVLSSRPILEGKLSRDLPESLREFLKKRNMSLFSHQCSVIEKIRQRKNVIITTPTASGKTLAFNLPIFETLQVDQKGTALYLYPTKALSNDQLKVIKQLEHETGIELNAAIYDGDTPRYQRPGIREQSRIVLSNPYMLHQILPWHFKWKKFLENLKFVVLDEAHSYRGVFGSNIAFLIRRFRRICVHYGSQPIFVISSATLANPLEFARKLTGLQFDLISEDGSNRSKKYFILYNPYFDGAGNRSVHQETLNLFKLLVWRHLQTLCFTTSRKMAELLISWTKSDFIQKTPGLVSSVTTYRAGYLPEERREIENKLKAGVLRGVVSTNALEVGIDVGTLDAVIISGFPGTMISTWQQAGRAGRGIDESMAILVAFQDQLDQYFMNHPQAFFDKPHEHAVIDLTNPYIKSGHLICAAAEMPLHEDMDVQFFGEDSFQLVDAFEQDGILRETSRGFVYAGTGRATDAVRLNNIGSELFKVLCDGYLLETMDRRQAYREAHEGAVLLHQGEKYVVTELDLKQRIIVVEKRNVNYYTSPLKVEIVRVLEEFEHDRRNEIDVFFGELEITEIYTAYRIMERDIPRGYVDL